VLTGLVGLVVVALLVAGGSYGYLQYRFDQLTKVKIPSVVPRVSGQPFNMLVIGSDSRVGESSSAFGSSSVVTGQRSDVLMIWHVDPATKQITVMSIPRDTLVSMDGDQSDLGTFNRINSAYNEGPNLLVQTIEDNFGIPINHVVQVDFAGFQGAVNALGGVWMDFPYPAKDAYSGLDITTPGCQLLNGTEALAVARSRHYYYYADGYWQYDGTSDFGRIQRQDAFLRAMINAAKSKTNPLTINAFLGSLPQGLVIDDSFSLDELIGLAATFRDFNPAALVTETMPTTSIGYVSPWGDILFVDQPAAQQMLVSIFGAQLTAPTTPPPDTSLESVPPPTVTPTSTPPATTAAHGAAGSAVTTTTAAPAAAPPSFDPTACSP
jgi:LCP family protein required for cell wall assembly